MATVDTEYLIRLSANRSVAIAGGVAKQNHALDYLRSYSISTTREVWGGSGSLDDAATVDIDLGALVQLDNDEGTVRASFAMSKVESVTVRNTGAVGGAGYIIVGGAVSNAWSGDGTLFKTSTDTACVQPGGILVWDNPSAIAVSTSADVIRLTASEAQTYEILIIGQT